MEKDKEISNGLINKSFTKLSHDLTKLISKKDKKAQGIFFTPPKDVQQTLNAIEPHIQSMEECDVLEPSCGSGEFMLALAKKFKSMNIDGIEQNEIIYKAILSLANDNINIINKDFLEYDSLKKYDLIIGNPPYFVMKKDKVDQSYYEYFDGRPNIFILFIIKSLNLLKENGILSFVLPKSFLNCLYYDKTRKYIDYNFSILNILECGDDFIDTKQQTIILIIQNNVKNNNDFTLKIDDYLIFGTSNSIKNLKLLYEESTTLSKMGFKVSVGNVVWNQCKKILTRDKSKTRLIYSSDIVGGKLVQKTYKNIDKKNFIDREGDTGPILVINRGYGTGNYNFEYCIIDIGIEYLIENHLICIKYAADIEKYNLTELYNKIIKSFNNEKTKEFIKLYFGNNAINTTELAFILPIYDI